MYDALAEVWPIGNPEFPLLQYIDPYGNAVFNGAQMPEVREEVEMLIGKCSDEGGKSVLLHIYNLALKCEKRAHKFLRFVGD